MSGKPNLSNLEFLNLELSILGIPNPEFPNLEVAIFSKTSLEFPTQGVVKGLSKIMGLAKCSSNNRSFPNYL